VSSRTWYTPASITSYRLIFSIECYRYVFLSVIENLSYRVKAVNERHRTQSYSVFLKPNWKHLKLQLNQCSSTGFVKIFSNHLKESRKGLRPVPQSFSMIFKILSKTALKLLVKSQFLVLHVKTLIFNNRTMQQPLICFERLPVAAFFYWIYGIKTMKEIWYCPCNCTTPKGMSRKFYRINTSHIWALRCKMFNQSVDSIEISTHSFRSGTITWTTSKHKYWPINFAKPPDLFFSSFDTIF